MENYINEIPLIIRNSLKALNDEIRQAILVYLLKNGSKSFIQISKELNISKNNLSHHIKTLVRYGMIYNYYNHNEFNDNYSFYEISKLGQKILDNLINPIKLIEPKIEESEYILTDAHYISLDLEESSKIPNRLTCEFASIITNVIGENDANSGFNSPVNPLKTKDESLVSW